jgi:hypothetical protein
MPRKKAEFCIVGLSLKYNRSSFCDLELLMQKMLNHFDSATYSDGKSNLE